MATLAEPSADFYLEKKSLNFMDMSAKKNKAQNKLFAPISCWNNEFNKKIRIRLFFIKKS
jgi:hypothetical protein